MDQTFSYLLKEQLLASDHNVDVLNFGTNGYSPAQKILLLTKEISHYDLDVVVIALFLDNDVSGCLPELSVSTTGTPSIKQSSAELEFDFSQTEASYNEFNKQPIETIRKYSGIYRILAKLKNDLQIQHCKDNCTEATFPTRFELYQQSPPVIWGAACEVFERSLNEFKQITDSVGIPLVFLSIPAGQVINHDAWQNIIKLNPAMREKT